MALDNTNTLLNRFHSLPFLTDGGIETYLIHHDGLDLPHFASFPLLRQDQGRDALLAYFAAFLNEAAALNMGFVLDTVTWRASVGWGARLGWSADDIDAVNREAVAFAQSLRAGRRDVILNGVIGPLGDANRPDEVLTPRQSEAYHARQITVLAEAGVDLVTAMTLTAPGEAIGIARAARQVGVPLALSFTVETNGKLEGGQSLAEAIATVDEATQNYPLWYGINCAHPDHFAAELIGDVVHRLGAVRANASRCSHDELAGAAMLDTGDPLELSQDMARIRQMVPQLRVLGGCCGTDLRHVAAMGQRFMERV